MTLVTRPMASGRISSMEENHTEEEENHTVGCIVFGIIFSLLGILMCSMFRAEMDADNRAQQLALTTVDVEFINEGIVILRCNDRGVINGAITEYQADGWVLVDYDDNRGRKLLRSTVHSFFVVTMTKD